MTLDDIDLKILDLLISDGRISHTTIGKETGLTAPSVYARVQRLEREGIIRGYTAIIDAEKIERGLAAFVRVRTQATAVDNQTFEQFIREEEQILECHDVDGEDCYILKVRTSSPLTLHELLLRIRSMPGVTRTVTSIALLTIKEESTSKPLSVRKKDRSNEEGNVV